MNLKEIHQYIATNPGATYQNISYNFRISRSSVKTAINLLRASELITTSKIGRSIAVYATDLSFDQDFVPSKKTTKDRTEDLYQLIVGTDLIQYSQLLKKLTLNRNALASSLLILSKAKRIFKYRQSIYGPILYSTSNHPELIQEENFHKHSVTKTKDMEQYYNIKHVKYMLFKQPEFLE